MRARRSLVIAGALGLLLLLPVVVIVGLGAYGESLGGSISSADRGSGNLTIQPANTRLGEPVRITGRGWPPAGEVSIYAYSGGSAEALPANVLTLARVRPSRSGSFELEAVLGQSLFAPGTGTVRVAAIPSDEPGAERVVVEIQILPFGNVVAVTVTGDRSGNALPDATVSVEDRFRRTAVTGRTDLAGGLLLEGAPPGPAILHVQLQDHSAHRQPILVPIDGRVEFQIQLTREPGHRLYMPAGYSDAGGARVIAIDRVSGLPVNTDVPAVGRGDLPLPDFGRNRHFSYIVAVDDQQSEGRSPLAIDSLSALAHVGRQVGGLRRSPAAWVNYVGRSMLGEVIYTTGGFGVIRLKQLYVVRSGGDPDESTSAYALPPDALMPVLAADRRTAYVVDWRQRTLSLFDLATGDVRVIARELPELLRQVVRDPSTNSLFLLSSAGGSIYRFDLSRLAVVGDPLPVSGAEYLAAAGDGRLLIVVPGDREIIAADSATLRIEAVVPLEEPLYWVWTAPGEPFVYAGRLDRDATISLYILDSATLRRAGRLLLPYGVAPDA